MHTVTVLHRAYCGSMHLQRQCTNVSTRDHCLPDAIAIAYVSGQPQQVCHPLVCAAVSQLEYCIAYGKHLAAADMPHMTVDYTVIPRLTNYNTSRMITGAFFCKGLLT